MDKQNKMNEEKQMGRKHLSLWGKAGIILGIAVLAGVISTLIQFFGNPSPTYISAQLQLTFDGAAQGKAPDGYAFSVDDIQSDEVITAALEKANLQEKYTAEQISSALVITGSYPDDIVRQTMNYDSLLNFTANRTLTVDRFYPTQFNVRLYNYFDKTISQAKLKELMVSLLDTYREYFVNVNVQGLPSNRESILSDLSEYDYPQQLQILELRMNLISSYAQEMYELDPTFRYHAKNFNDIVARVNNLVGSDISRMNANMTLSALTKDPERLRTQYQFELLELNNRLTKRHEEIAKLDALIDSYSKSEIIYISSADSLTMIDGNSSVTYDALIDLRRDVAAENTETNASISTYNLMLEDLSLEDSTQIEAEIIEPAVSETSDMVSEIGEMEDISDIEEQIDLLFDNSKEVKRAEFEADVAVLEEKYQAVVAEFSEMMQAWNKSKLNDDSVSYMNLRYNSPKLLSGDFIKKGILTSGPIIALGLIVSLIYIVYTKKREEIH